MTAIDAVFFDLMGTLVGYPTSRWRIERALERCGQANDPMAVTAHLERLEASHGSAQTQRDLETEDHSIGNHHATNMGMLRRAGFDPELAAAYYDMLSDLRGHPWLPGAINTVKALASKRLVIVSDIHFDVRPMFAEVGLDHAIDGYVLSFERGYQKPDRRMFQDALDIAGVEPSAALMVGDRHDVDGGAAMLGIPTLILPPQAHLDGGSFSLVLDIVEPRAAG